MAEERGSGEVESKAREGAERAGGAGAARDLLAREPVGVLSTVSVRYEGTPYGTLVPYALSARGAPLFLLSALAQHTRNLEADARATLLVFDAAAASKDPRTAARVTLVGRVRKVQPEEEADARERFVARQPGSRGLLALDFSLWQLQVEEAQFVGGFGAAAFFTAEELAHG